MHSVVRTPFRERMGDAALSIALALVAFTAAALMTSHLLGSHDWILAAVAAGWAASGWLVVAALVCVGLLFLLHALVRGRFGLSPDRRIMVVDQRTGKTMEESIGGS